MSVDKKIERCFQEGKKGGERHKGMATSVPNQESTHQHIQKAIHNLKAMNIFKEQGFSDWSVSAGFYALYHLLLAVLSKEGYESRNQSCTFAFIEKMIEEERIPLTLDELRMIYSTKMDLAQSNTILDLREKYQYQTRTLMEEEEFNELKLNVKRLFDKLRNYLEQ